MDTALSHGMAVLGSLGLAGLMSPELLVLGLLLAGDTRAPGLKTLAFAGGTVLGLGVAMVAGYYLTPLDLHHIPKPSWHGVFLRVVIGGALLAVGIDRIIERAHLKPGMATTTASPRTEREIPATLRRFMPLGAAAATMSTTRAALLSGTIGLMVGAISPKRLPICMAAGHLLSTFPTPGARVAGATLFMALALIPSLFPLALVLIRPAAANAVRGTIERWAARYGLRLLALLLILLGLHFLYASLALIPIHGRS